MSGQNNGGADPFAAAADHSERLKWYQEVLSLDPDSRIFLPYARLVAGTGRSGTAIDILKKGLAKHPEFLEARLELLDLLEGGGQRSAAMAEAAELIGQLSAHPSFWEIWSRMPGVRTDMSAMLIFFASCMKSDGYTLPIPPSPAAGKCSLLTRSMAAVLEEQGALEDAAGIYRELIEQAGSDEERDELNAKLESLTRSIPAEGQQHASVIGMLEELADHLEQRARG